MRAAFVWGFVALALFLLVGCSPAPPASEVESGARKVITFEGGDVTEGEVQEGIERLRAASTAASGQSAPEVKPGSPQFEAAKRQVVPQLLALNLAEAYARENSIKVSDKEVQEEVGQAKEELAQQAEAVGRGGDPEELFQEALKQFGYTESSFREEVRRSLLVQKVQDEAVGELEPAEEEVEDFYEENKETQFTVPEQRCIRHILFTEDQGDKAEEVKRELEDRGDFEELARENSQDPVSRENGGDLGCQAKGAFTPEFDDAAFGAREGEIVGPIKTEFGYHVLEVTEIRAENERPLEEVAPEIEEQLSRQRRAIEFDAWVRDELERRSVKYLPGYNPAERTPSGIPGGPVPEGEAPGEEAAPQGKTKE
jgi:parvulin-like peptidyl-prolyl isomerase